MLCLFEAVSVAMFCGLSVQFRFSSVIPLKITFVGRWVQMICSVAG